MWIKWRNQITINWLNKLKIFQFSQSGAIMNTIDTSFKKRISWASIFAGVLTTLAISFLLSLLGMALGFSMLDPMSNTDVTNGSGTAVSIWAGLSLLVSLGLGGYIAGRLAGLDGAIHGFLTWALSLIIGLFISVSTLSGALSMTGSALGSIGSATGNLASSVGKGSADLVKSIDFDSIMPNTDNLADSTNKNVVDALKKSNIPQLQPNYLNSQLDWAKQQTQQAVKDIAMNPQQGDQIIDQLVKKLKDRAQSINNSIGRDEIKAAIVKNSNLSNAEADRAVDNFIKERDQAVAKANQFFEQAQMNIDQAKVRYQELKAEARQKAAVATQAAAKAALWSFIGLLIGMVVSIFCGRIGSKSLKK